MLLLFFQLLFGLSIVILLHLFLLKAQDLKDKPVCSMGTVQKNWFYW